ncbi:conserved hypothetical protein [Lodderomyces elongisporus NRRL YB-4239]|uniref:HTH APSES-type domain-containing protein n=1 Tax=Lodderomyces elongisporus (strain ATCC 11503 / CBS 2605 / JCM 1781 / NBRC 1676 / NRRL YB-4239) TaxID=379508 RepID=A5E701_LODEL|nr:conserved hypothetical protein [Lodderomyces elongisporus NRRL YB-4239]
MEITTLQQDSPLAQLLPPVFLKVNNSNNNNSHMAHTTCTTNNSNNQEQQQQHQEQQLLQQITHHTDHNNQYPPSQSAYYQQQQQQQHVPGQLSQPQPLYNAGRNYTSAPAAPQPPTSASSLQQQQQLHHQPPVSQSHLASAAQATPLQDTLNPTSTSTVGQFQPPGIRPRVTTTMWEDEKTLCYQVDANNVSVVRRADNNMINGTKLLNVAQMTRGRRDGILKLEKVRHVVKIGSMHLKGVWIPFERALTMAQRENIVDLLYPLFVRDIKRVIQTGVTPNTGASAGNAGGANASSAVATSSSSSGNPNAGSISAPGTAPSDTNSIVSGGGNVSAVTSATSPSTSKINASNPQQQGTAAYYQNYSQQYPQAYAQYSSGAQQPGSVGVGATTATTTTTGNNTTGAADHAYPNQQQQQQNYNYQQGYYANTAAGTNSAASGAGQYYPYQNYSNYPQQGGYNYAYLQQPQQQLHHLQQQQPHAQVGGVSGGANAAGVAGTGTAQQSPQVANIQSQSSTQVSPQQQARGAAKEEK